MDAISAPVMPAGLSEREMLSDVPGRVMGTIYPPKKRQPTRVPEIIRGRSVFSAARPFARQSFAIRGRRACDGIFAGSSLGTSTRLARVS